MQIAVVAREVKAVGHVAGIAGLETGIADNIEIFPALGLLVRFNTRCGHSHGQAFSTGEYAFLDRWRVVGPHGQMLQARSGQASVLEHRKAVAKIKRFKFRTAPKGIPTYHGDILRQIYFGQI